MSPAENGSGPGTGDPLSEARTALRQAREALREAERAVESAESDGPSTPENITVEGPQWTWREKLWAAPAECRIGVRELVEALDVSESWIYARTTEKADDPIPHRKMGGRLTFLVGEVRAWIREREEAPVSGPMWSPNGSGLELVEGGR